MMRRWTNGVNELVPPEFSSRCIVCEDLFKSKGWESRKDSWQRNEDEAEEILGVT